MLESLHRVAKFTLRSALRAVATAVFLLVAACGFSQGVAEGFNQGASDEARVALDRVDRLLAAAEPSPEREEFVSIARALRTGLDNETAGGMAVSFSAGMIEGVAEDGVLTAAELRRVRSSLPDGVVMP